MFSGIIALHYQAFILFSLIPTLFVNSFHLSFLFHVTDRIHLISSLLILITSLYLLSFSINLDSILCSMYYDLSISYPYLSLITPLSFYSISFYAYSYPVSSIPIHFIGSHFSIRHRTQLLISIHSHLNTPYPLPSFILSQFYSSIHIVLSVIPYSPLHPPSLLYSIFIHPLVPFLYLFIIYSSLFPFIPFHIILSLSFYSHSVLHPIPFQYHCPILFFLSLLQTTLGFSPSIVLFVPRLLSIIILLIHLYSILPYSFTQHLFYSFSSLLSFHSHSIELEIVVFGRRTSI